MSIQVPGNVYVMIYYLKYGLVHKTGTPTLKYFSDITTVKLQAL